jgi:hypothetical protein
MTTRSGCIRSQYAPWCCQKEPPSTFGLSDEERWAEAQRLVAAGWSLDEVRAVLELPDCVS